MHWRSSVPTDLGGMHHRSVHGTVRLVCLEDLQQPSVQESRRQGLRVSVSVGEVIGSRYILVTLPLHSRHLRTRVQSTPDTSQDQSPLSKTVRFLTSTRTHGHTDTQTYALTTLDVDEKCDERWMALIARGGTVRTVLFCETGYPIYRPSGVDMIGNDIGELGMMDQRRAIYMFCETEWVHVVAIDM